MAIVNRLTVDGRDYFLPEPVTELKTAEWEPATWPIRAGAFGVPIDHVYARAPLKIKSLTRLAEQAARDNNEVGPRGERPATV